ncbi:MAG: hypothetical protein EKK53_27835 [Burkholderiales bacterium]|nr:MAG: hypothetical protein EKK53_27835 [Burkholderiales bacterium]
MNLLKMHEWTGQLLAAGVDKDLPVTCLVDGWPHEVCDAALAIGEYSGDPAPRMTAFASKSGRMLVLEPIQQDLSDLFNPRDAAKPPTHVQRDLPVDFPYPG